MNAIVTINSRMVHPEVIAAKRRSHRAPLWSLWRQWHGRWSDIARPIGPNTALAFVLTIGPVTRFRCSKKIASYLGLNPSEDPAEESGGAISKQGNTMVRWLLIETVHHAVRQDPELRQAYQRVSSPQLLFPYSPPRVSTIALN